MVIVLAASQWQGIDPLAALGGEWSRKWDEEKGDEKRPVKQDNHPLAQLGSEWSKKWDEEKGVYEERIEPPRLASTTVETAPRLKPPQLEERSAEKGESEKTKRKDEKKAKGDDKQRQAWERYLAAGGAGRPEDFDEDPGSAMARAAVSPMLDPDQLTNPVARWLAALLQSLTGSATGATPPEVGDFEYAVQAGSPKAQAAADITGQILGNIAQFVTAGAVGGGVTGALGKVPQLARIGQLSPEILRVAGRGATTGAVREGLRALSRQELPDPKEAAGRIAFTAGARTAGAGARQAIEHLLPGIHPLIEAPLAGAAAGAGGAAAAYPFSGKPFKEYAKESLPQIAAMAILETVLTAGTPSTWKPKQEFTRAANEARQAERRWETAIKQGDDAARKAAYRDMMDAADRMYHHATRSGEYAARDKKVFIENLRTVAAWKEAQLSGSPTGGGETQPTTPLALPSAEVQAEPPASSESPAPVVPTSEAPSPTPTRVPVPITPPIEPPGVTGAEETQAPLVPDVAPPTPPEKPTPATQPFVLRVNRGNKGQVKVVFPDRAYADLYNIGGIAAKQGAANIDSSIMSGIREKLGWDEEVDVLAEATAYHNRIKPMVGIAVKGDRIDAPAHAMEQAQDADVAVPTLNVADMDADQLQAELASIEERLSVVAKDLAQVGYDQRKQAQAHKIGNEYEALQARQAEITEEVQRRAGEDVEAQVPTPTSAPEIPASAPEPARPTIPTNYKEWADEGMLQQLMADLESPQMLANREANGGLYSVRLAKPLHELSDGDLRFAANHIGQKLERLLNTPPDAPGVIPTTVITASIAAERDLEIVRAEMDRRADSIAMPEETVAEPPIAPDVSSTPTMPEPTEAPIAPTVAEATETEGYPGSTAEDATPVRVPVNEIGVDAKRFQFKAVTDPKTGTSPLLSDVQKWNAIFVQNLTLWEDKSGKLWVVNGHHRLDLAQRLGVPDVNAVVLKETDGISEADARAMGALENIAQGRGTSIDAAKLIRDQGWTREDMAKLSVPLRENVVEQGLALSNLADWIFTNVANSKLPQTVGLAIGRELPGDDTAQAAVINLLEKAQKKGRRISGAVLEELIRTVKGANTSSQTVATLFGDEIFTKSNALEKAELIDSVKRQFRSMQKGFGQVARAKMIEMLEGAGNVLATETNLQMASDAAIALELVDKTAHYKGNPINDILNKWADYMASGGNPRHAKEMAFREVSEAMEGGKLLDDLIRGQVDTSAGGDEEALDDQPGLPGFATAGVPEGEHPGLGLEHHDAGDPGTQPGLFGEAGTDVEAVEVAVAPEPWQMTRDDYAKASVNEETWQRFLDSRSDPAAKVDSWITEGFEMHEQQVQQALAEGKPVPPEVLADYPNLVAKSGTATLPEPIAEQATEPEAAPDPASIKQQLQSSGMAEWEHNGVREKVKIVGGIQRGTWDIELYRSVPGETGSRRIRLAELGESPLNSLEEAQSRVLELAADANLRDSMWGEPAEEVTESPVPSEPEERVAITEPPNLHDANPADLAADYKARGMDRFRAWDQFIIDRNLEPEMDAQGFYAIYDVITPKPLAGKQAEVDFKATHIYKPTSQQVMVTPRGDGTHEMVFPDGHTGGIPVGGLTEEYYQPIEMAKPRPSLSIVGADNIIQLKFPDKPDTTTVQRLHEGGWKYAKHTDAWVLPYTPENMEAAQKLAMVPDVTMSVEPETPEVQGAPRGPWPPPTTPTSSPTSDVKPITRMELLRLMEDTLDTAIRTGHLRNKRSQGEYHTRQQDIRLRQAEDMETAAHEIGHHVTRTLGIRDVSPELMALGARLYPNADPYLQNSEGIAEFFRLYLTQPQEAQAQAPGFYTKLQDKLAQDPEMKQALDALQDGYRRLYEQDDFAKMESMIAREISEPKRLLTFSERVYERLVNDMIAIEKITDMLTEPGAQLAPEDNPGLLAASALSAHEKARLILEETMVDPNGNPTGPSLKERLNVIKSEGDQKAFEHYLIAKRGRWLEDQGIETGEPEPGIYDRVIADIERNRPEFVAAAESLYEYSHQLTDLLVGAGIVSPDLAQHLADFGLYYIPFNRAFEPDEMRNAIINAASGKSYVDLGQPIKRIKGSSRSIISPLESLVNNTYMFISVAERNKVGRALGRLADAVEGQGEWISRIPAPVEATPVRLEELERHLVDAGIPEHVLDAADLDRLVTTFSTIGHVRPGDSHQNIISVWDKGKRKYYQVHPEIYGAMKSLDGQQANFITRIMRVPAKWLRTGATLNPEFAFGRNPIRDQGTAMMFTETGYTPLDLVQGVASAFHRDEWYQQWVASGGAHGTMASLNRETLQQNLDDLLGREHKNVAIRGIGWFLNLFPTGLEKFEQATRLGEFQRYFDKDLGKLRQATQGEKVIAGKGTRDVTVDFQRAGTWIRTLNQSIPFLNPGIQGTDKMIREAQKNPGRFFARGFFYFTIPSLILYALTYNDKRRKALPAWRRMLFWNIPVPGVKFLIPIPKPFEPGIIFASLPEAFLDWVSEEHPGALKEWAQTIVDSTVPDLLPTMMRVPIEIWANRVFFTGGKIVPSAEEAYLEAGLASEAYGPETTEFAKTLAKAMNESARALGGEGRVSPRQIEHVITGFTAGMGRHFLDLTDLLWGGALLEKKAPIEYLPVVKAFVVDPYRNAQPVNDFYNEYYRHEAELRHYNERARTGGTPTRAPDVNRLAALRQFKREIDARQAYIKDMVWRKDIPADERKRRITVARYEMLNIALRAQGKETITVEESGLGDDPIKFAVPPNYKRAGPELTVPTPLNPAEQALRVLKNMRF